jgi:hypothetical protein
MDASEARDEDHDERTPTIASATVMSPNEFASAAASIAGMLPGFGAGRRHERMSEESQPNRRKSSR